MDSSWNKYADLALVTPRHSGIPGVFGGEGGGVYSPPPNGRDRAKFSEQILIKNTESEQI